MYLKPRTQERKSLDLYSLVVVTSVVNYSLHSHLNEQKGKKRFFRNSVKI